MPKLPQYLHVATGAAALLLLVVFSTPKITYAQTPSNWFKVQGKVHSEGRSPDTDLADAIKVLLTPGKVFNTSRGTTSARGEINVGQGLVSSPSPFPRLKPYSVISSDITYTRLFSRMQNPPTPISGAIIANAAPANGVYIVNGNLDITGSWNLGGPGQPKHVAVFVNGELILSNNIVVAPGAFLAFIVKNDISVKKHVSNLQGIYYTDNKICTKCRASGVVDN